MKKPTLEQRIAEITQIDSRIKKFKEEKIINSLINDRRKLEFEICNRLNKEKMNDPVLEYCFSRLIEIYIGENVKSKDYQSTLEKVPIVRSFIEDVRKFKRNKILYIEGNDIETGIIEGNCQIKSEGKNKVLSIPTKKLAFLNGRGVWNSINENLLYINSEIFRYPKKPNRNKNSLIWNTDYSQKKYGEIPRDINIYFGNKLVEKEIRKLELKLSRR